MYQNSLPHQTMVQVAGGFPANNGYYRPIQHHNYFYNAQNNMGHHTDFPPQFLRNTSNHNRHRPMQVQQKFIWNGNFPLNFMSMIRVDHSQVNSHYQYFRAQNHNRQNNWQNRKNGLTNGGYKQNETSPSSNNRSNDGPRSATKKNSWINTGFNRQGKRQQRYSETSSSQETNISSDSGVSSRSPTPNKYFIEATQAESSDDRDSVNSASERNLKYVRQNNYNNHKKGVDSDVLAVKNWNLNQRQTNENENFVFRSQNNQNYKHKQYQYQRSSPGNSYRHVRNFPPRFEFRQNSFDEYPNLFLEKSHLIEMKGKPSNLVNGSKYDQLSKDIWDKFEKNQQTYQTFCKKMELWKVLSSVLKKVNDSYNLFMVGSTLNGFGMINSDVDMCLVLRNAEMDQKIEAWHHLNNVLSVLQKYPHARNLFLIQAKVPILKFSHVDFKIDVDLNCNNTVGIRNTRLLYCYAQMDWRVRPLVLIVKLWAQRQNINDAKNMTLSSYSLALMVIFFLQRGACPAVLPCLQKLCFKSFNSHNINFDIYEELNIPSHRWQPQNDQSIGELLIEFFKYYDTFDFEKFAISVRSADKILIDECRQTVSMKNDPYQWKYLCIEEPFDLTNTARSVYDPEVYRQIKTIIQQTYQKLSKTRNLFEIFGKLGNN